MNKIVLIGRFTKDPELKTTKAGISVCSFTLAVNRRFAKEGQQSADFINCIAWRQTAEFICKYFTKGRMIGVVGNIQTGKYEKDGQTHYTTDVVVDEAYFVGDKKEDKASEYEEVPEFNPVPDEDNLPF